MCWNVVGKGIVSMAPLQEFYVEYDVLGELYLTHLTGLMGSKADSRTGDP